MPQKQATSTANRSIRPHRRLSFVKYALTLSLLSVSVGDTHAQQASVHNCAGQVFVVETVAIGSNTSSDTTSDTTLTVQLSKNVQFNDHAQSRTETTLDPADTISTDISTLTGGIHWPKAGIPGFAYPDQNTPDPLWSSPTIVPLPPAVWAGLIGTAIIGTQLVLRSLRRPSRARLF